MSATNRGYQRHRDDYYLTPKWIIEDFLADFAFHELRCFDFGEAHILDPCAGGDIKHEMPYPYVLETMGHRYKKMVTNDIRIDSPAKHHIDFLESSIVSDSHNSLGYDLVISNPPFNLAQEFVEGGLNAVHDFGYVVYLLRLNFFGSQKRNEWIKTFRPEWCVIHSKRPSFTPDGKTDATEYAHFVWNRNKIGKIRYTKTIVI